MSKLSLGVMGNFVYRNKLLFDCNAGVSFSFNKCYRYYYKRNWSKRNEHFDTGSVDSPCFSVYETNILIKSVRNRGMTSHLRTHHHRNHDSTILNIFIWNVPFYARPLKSSRTPCALQCYLLFYTYSGLFPSVRTGILVYFSFTLI